VNRYAIAALAGLLYALTYATCSGLDKDHCQAHGAQYGGTSLSLEGFCEVSGVEVPAGSIGRP
jgi:hypothetical protein